MGEPRPAQRVKSVQWTDLSGERRELGRAAGSSPAQPYPSPVPAAHRAGQAARSLFAPAGGDMGAEPGGVVARPGLADFVMVQWDAPGKFRGRID
jgi:hypothetical protein